MQQDFNAGTFAGTSAETSLSTFSHQQGVSPNHSPENHTHSPPPPSETLTKITDTGCYFLQARQNGSIDETGQVLLTRNQPLSFNHEDQRRIIESWKTPFENPYFAGNLYTFLSYLVPYLSSKLYRGTSIYQTQGAISALGKEYWERNIKTKISPSLAERISSEQWNFCSPLRCFEFWVCLPNSEDPDEAKDPQEKQEQLQRLQEAVIKFWAVQSLPQLPENYLNVLRDFNGQMPDGIDEPMRIALYQRYLELIKIRQSIQQFLVPPNRIEEQTNVASVEIQCSPVASLKVIFAFTPPKPESFICDHYPIKISSEVQFEDEKKTLVLLPKLDPDLNGGWQGAHDHLIQRLALDPAVQEAPSLRLALSKYWAHVTCSGAAFQRHHLERRLAPLVDDSSLPIVLGRGKKYLTQGDDALIAYYWNVIFFLIEHRIPVPSALMAEVRSLAPSASDGVGALLVSDEFISGDLNAMMQIIGVLQASHEFSLADAPKCRKVADSDHLQISWKTLSYHHLLLPLDFSCALDQVIVSVRRNDFRSLNLLSKTLEVLVPSFMKAARRTQANDNFDPRLITIYRALRNQSEFSGAALRLLFLMESHGWREVDEGDVLSIPHWIRHMTDILGVEAKVKLKPALDLFARVFSGTRFEHVYADMERNVLALQNPAAVNCQVAALKPLLICGDSKILGSAWTSYAEVSSRLKAQTRFEFLFEICSLLEGAAFPFAMSRVSELCKTQFRPADKLRLLGSYLERLVRLSPQNSSLQNASLSHKQPLVESLRLVLGKEPTLQFELVSAYPEAAKEYFSLDGSMNALLAYLRKSLPLVKTDPQTWWEYCTAVDQMLQHENNEERTQRFDSILLPALQKAAATLCEFDGFEVMYGRIADRLFERRNETDLLSLLEWISETQFESTTHPRYRGIFARHLEEKAPVAAWIGSFTAFRKCRAYAEANTAIDRPLLLQILTAIVNPQNAEHASSDETAAVHALVSRVQPESEELAHLRDFFLAHYNALLKLKSTDRLLDELNVSLAYFMSARDPRVGPIIHEIVYLLSTQPTQKSLWIKFDQILQQLEREELFLDDPFFFLYRLLTDSHLRDPSPVTISSIEVLRGCATSDEALSSVFECLEQTVFLAQSDPGTWLRDCITMRQLLQEANNEELTVRFDAVFLKTVLTSAAILSELEGFTGLYSAVADRLFERRNDTGLLTLLELISKTKLEPTTHSRYKALFSRFMDENAPVASWIGSFTGFRRTPAYSHVNEIIDRTFLLRVLAVFIDPDKTNGASRDVFFAVLSIIKRIKPANEDIPRDYFLSYYSALQTVETRERLLDDLAVALGFFISAEDLRVTNVILRLASLLLSLPHQKELWVKFSENLKKMDRGKCFQQEPLLLLARMVSDCCLRNHQLDLSNPNVINGNSSLLEVHTALLDCLEQTVFLLNSDAALWCEYGLKVELLLRKVEKTDAFADRYDAIVMKGARIAPRQLGGQERFADIFTCVADRLFNRRNETSLVELLELAPPEFDGAKRLRLRDIVTRRLDEQSPMGEWMPSLEAYMRAQILVGTERLLTENGIDRPFLVRLLAYAAQPKEIERGSLAAGAAVIWLTRTAEPQEGEVPFLFDYLLVYFKTRLNVRSAAVLIDDLLVTHECFAAASNTEAMRVVEELADLLMTDEGCQANLWSRFADLLMLIEKEDKEKDKDLFLEPSLLLLEKISAESFVKNFSPKSEPMRCFRQFIPRYSKRLSPAQQIRYAKVYARVVQIDPKICRAFPANWLEQNLKTVETCAELTQVFCVNPDRRAEDALWIATNQAVLPPSLLDDFIRLLPRLPTEALATAEWKRFLVASIIRKPDVLLFPPLVSQANGEEKAFFERCRRLQAGGADQKVNEMRALMSDYLISERVPEQKNSEGKKAKSTVVKASSPVADPLAATRQEIQSALAAQNFKLALSLLKTVPAGEYQLWMAFFSVGCLTPTEELEGLRDEIIALWFEKHSVKDVLPEHGEFWDRAITIMYADRSASETAFAVFLNTHALNLLLKLENKPCENILMFCLERAIIYCANNQALSDNLVVILAALKGIMANKVVQKKSNGLGAMLAFEKFSERNFKKALSLLEKASSENYRLWIGFFAIALLTPMIQLDGFLDRMRKLWFKKHPIEHAKPEQGRFWEIALMILYARSTATESAFTSFLTTDALNLIRQLGGASSENLLRFCFEGAVLYCLNKPDREMHTPVLSVCRDIIVERQLKSETSPMTLISTKDQCRLSLLFAQQTDDLLHQQGDSWYHGIVTSFLEDKMDDSPENLLLFGSYCTQQYVPRSAMGQGLFFEWIVRSWNVHRSKLNWNDACKIISTLCQFNYEELNKDEVINYWREVFRLWDDLHKGTWEEESVHIGPSGQVYQTRNVRSSALYESATLSLMEKPMKKIQKLEMLKLLNAMRFRYRSNAIQFNAPQIKARFHLHYCTFVFSFVSLNNPESHPVLIGALEDLIHGIKYLPSESSDASKNGIIAFIGALPDILNQKDEQVSALLASNLDNLKRLPWVVNTAGEEKFSWNKILQGLCGSVGTVSDTRREAVVRFVRDIFVRCTHRALVTEITEETQKHQFIERNALTMASSFLTLPETECLAPKEWSELIQGLNPVHALTVLGKLIENTLNVSSKNTLWNWLAAARLIRHLKTNDKQQLEICQTSCEMGSNDHLRDLQKTDDDRIRFLSHWILAVANIMGQCEGCNLAIPEVLIKRKFEFTFELVNLLLKNIKDSASYKKYSPVLLALAGFWDLAMMVNVQFKIDPALPQELVNLLASYKEILTVKSNQCDANRALKTCSLLLRVLQLVETEQEDFLNYLQDLCLFSTSSKFQDFAAKLEGDAKIQWLSQSLAIMIHLTAKFEEKEIDGFEVCDELFERKKQFAEELAPLLFGCIKDRQSFIKYSKILCELADDIDVIELLVEYFHIDSELPAEVQTELSRLKSSFEQIIAEYMDE